MPDHNADLIARLRGWPDISMSEPRSDFSITHIMRTAASVIEDQGRVMREAADGFEPGTAVMANRPDDVTSLRSIAISLKRIADALDLDALGTRKAHALDVLMENAGHAFSIGMRGRG